MSNALFVLATVYRTIYTVAGGYITARLAPNRPMRARLDARCRRSVRSDCGDDRNVGQRPGVRAKVVSARARRDRDSVRLVRRQTRAAHGNDPVIDRQ